MLEVGAWALLGEELCGLVDRLRAAEYRHTLGVELRITGIGGGYEGYDFAEFLPEFRERGVVTVADAFNDDQILHCSTHNR